MFCTERLITNEGKGQRGEKVSIKIEENPIRKVWTKRQGENSRVTETMKKNEEEIFVFHSF